MAYQPYLFYGGGGIPIHSGLGLPIYQQPMIIHTQKDIYGTGFLGQQTTINQGYFSPSSYGITKSSFSPSSYSGSTSSHNSSPFSPSSYSGSMSSHNSSSTTTTTTFSSASNGRIIKTVRWPDGTYEMFDDYYDGSGNFLCCEQTHKRF